MSGAAPGIRLSGDFHLGEVTLFTDLTLRVRPGRWTCLLGPSGIGKSTLLRLMAGLETGGTFSGTIAADDGQPLHGRLAYMGQTDLIAPWLDVIGAVAQGARLRGEVPDHERARAMIERVGLTDHATKRRAELSGGMRQRVALARTLMEDRPVALLDEPFSALDSRTRAEMQELAFEVLDQRTVLLVTHDPAEAARLGHHIVLMTESGLVDMPSPPTPPARAVDDAETLRAQAGLYRALRHGAGA